MRRLAARAGVLLSVLLFSTATVAVAQQNQPSARTKQIPVRDFPFPTTSAVSGRKMFEAYCATCHGRDAKGHGPVALVLKVQPPDLTTLSRRHGGKFPATYVENVLKFGPQRFPAHGTKEMPAWGPILASIEGESSSTTTLRIYNITHYIESLQSK